MARYWIRNRGRVQGPFSEERIQGLLRRGRFSRHFHVSEDRKNWYPAGDFPELFEGAGGPEPSDDDGPFRSGGSPFDDDNDEDDDDYDDEPAPRRRSSSKQKPKRRAPVPDDDDEEEEDDGFDDDDEDWEDDDDSGLLTGLVDWIEANTKLLVAILIPILGVLLWFMLGGEDFTQDTEDLETLRKFQSQIIQAHQSGAQADQWISMLETIPRELAPMVSRLEAEASAMDHVKQELLFVARDDIPRMLKELPANKQDAAQRVLQKLEAVDKMITAKTRFNEADAFMAPRQSPQANPPPAGNGAPNNGMPQNGAESTNPAMGQPESQTQSAQPPGGTLPPNGMPNPTPNAGNQ